MKKIRRFNAAISSKAFIVKGIPFGAKLVNSETDGEYLSLWFEFNELVEYTTSMFAVQIISEYDSVREYMDYVKTFTDKDGIEQHIYIGEP